MQIELKNVNLGKFKNLLTPAKSLSNKITINIETSKNRIFGAAGGHDKFKFWEDSLTSNICDTIDAHSQFNYDALIRLVILDVNNLFNTMSILGDEMDVVLQLDSKGSVYEVPSITIKKGTIAIRFACANVATADMFISDEEKNIKLGDYGNAYKFALSSEALLLIKRLSHTQTLAQRSDYVVFGNKDGKLYVHNDVFDYVFDDIHVGDMQNYKFDTSVFSYVDNDNYDMTITQTPNGIDKIVFISKDRNIQFVCSLLVDIDESINDSIGEQFDSFINS